MSWDANVCMFGIIARYGMPHIPFLAYMFGLSRCDTVRLGAARRRRAVLGATLFPSAGVAPQESEANACVAIVMGGTEHAQ